MTNLYCPNCHRQLHEIDVAMGICAMCGTLLDVEHESCEDGVTKEEIINAVAKSEDEVRILELILDDHQSTNDYTQAEMTIEEISKKISEMEEYKKLQEMKEKKQIEEAVIITHPKNKGFVGNTGIKYVIFSYFCEENKIYMVTDEKLKQTIKDKIDKGE